MQTFLRWTGLAAMGLVVLLVLGYAVSGMVGTVQVMGAKDDARETVRQLARDTGDVDRQVRLNRETLGDPLRSWSQVVCEMETHDSGWVVDSWYQRCALRQVDIYPASDLGRAKQLEDSDRRVDAQNSSDLEGSSEPAPAQGTLEGFGSTAATPPRWSVRGDLEEGEPVTVVTVSGPVAEPDLGCNPWWVVLCDEPVDRPVMPD